MDVGLLAVILCAGDITDILLCESVVVW